jgi:hypothetical protein
MPTNDEMNDLAARLSRLTPEQLAEVKRRTDPAPVSFSARPQPQAESLQAMLDRVRADVVREALGDQGGAFRGSAAHGSASHADADDEVETLPALDDPVSRRILRPFQCEGLEVATAAMTALREFNALRDSPACALTSMGAERYLAAHPLVLEARGVATFHGR